MLTKVTSFANVGLLSEKITVEVGCSPGEAHFMIVGLGDIAVQESKQRVKLALRSSGFKLPTGRSITVNLAPANIKKVGPRYDLPIALGLLLASGAVEMEQEMLAKKAFLGELALDGSVRHVSGVLPAALACRRHGMETIVVPQSNAAEAALVPGVAVIGVESLQDLLAVLLGDRVPDAIPSPAGSPAGQRTGIDFSDIRGQQQAKRALEIAAAGGHNVLLSGAPGSGKTLLAQALKGILPPLSREESLEVTQIYSVANLLPNHTPLIEQRPFRMVHHTASSVSIVGGGTIPGPGEISLAHRGVLFLDELAEFPPHVLETLRQPMEDRTVTITRAQGTVTFPSDFLLVAAMNPPSYGARPARQVRRRISAPLLDRMDLTISVQPVPIDDLRQGAHAQSESSPLIAARILSARERQQHRFQGLPLSTNKEMDLRHLREFCPLDAPSEALLKQAAVRLALSARGYHRTIKVARTIADLSDSDTIQTPHIAEALQYRQPIGVEMRE